MTEELSPSGASVPGAVLDHIAHAVPSWEAAWPRYAVELGAEWNSGGPGPGFAPGQLRFANGSRLEVLMPYDVERNDFLERFLGSAGPGPHHLTFKVSDIDVALDRARQAGFEPVGVDLSDPEWKEVFLHPRQATGIVVQLAQARGDWISPPPDGYPVDRRQRRTGQGPVPPASLLWVTHAVAEIDEGLALFAGLLGGTIASRGRDPGGDEEWVDLRWNGPLGLRLVAPVSGRDVEGTPGSLRQWIGGRTGRMHHAVFDSEDPQALSGAHRAPAGLSGVADPAGTGSTLQQPLWEIAPEDNLGLRLVVTESPRATEDGTLPGGR